MMTLPAIEWTWIRTGGYGRLRDEWVYTITSVLSFNVLGHAGRDTPSIDSIWRMSGSLSSKRSLLDRFRPGGYFSDAP